MNTTFDHLAGLHVKWEATEVGLTPFFVEGNSEAILALGEKAVPDLINALSDKNLFVNAHLLLTQISGIEYQAFPAWNGLKVEITSDGIVTIDPNERYDLARRWEQWYQSEPRPTVLPPAN